MQDVEAAFLELLAPSDELKVVIKALLLDDSLERGVRPNDKLLEDAPNMRFLAVVVHKEDLDVLQEAGYAAFIFYTLFFSNTLTCTSQCIRVQVDRSRAPDRTHIPVYAKFFNFNQPNGASRFRVFCYRSEYRCVALRELYLSSF